MAYEKYGYMPAMPIFDASEPREMGRCWPIYL